MEEQQTKSKKNHWTSTKVDSANKKINQEIYQRRRQAPLQVKMDDLAIFINDKITRRGIAKGLVFVQADLNKNILVAEKKILQALLTNNMEEQYKLILQTKQLMKIEVWTDIRFLMINKAITPRRNYRINKKTNRDR